MRSILSVIAALLVTLAAEAQPRELLQPLRVDQAARLQEYNSTFLRRQTYWASRYRIVRVDTNLLLDERDITVTPFDDVEPIRLTWHNTRRGGEDLVEWIGLPDDPRYEELGEAVATKIWMHAWDLDESGNALVSARNRFEFSPRWTFDENDQPVLEGVARDRQGIVAALTPPPRTPEEIERHKRLKRLDKHAFFSVSAVFDVGTRSKYVLEPLRYTPRYAVIYEIPPETEIPRLVDSDPRGRELATLEQRAIIERYRAAMDRLPREEGKEIKGDLQ